MQTIETTRIADLSDEHDGLLESRKQFVKARKQARRTTSQFGGLNFNGSVLIAEHCQGEIDAIDDRLRIVEAEMQELGVAL